MTETLQAVESIDIKRGTRLSFFDHHPDRGKTLIPVENLRSAEVDIGRRLDLLVLHESQEAGLASGHHEDRLLSLGREAGLTPTRYSVQNRMVRPVLGRFVQKHQLLDRLRCRLRATTPQGIRG